MPTDFDTPIEPLAALHTAALEAAETAFAEVHDRIEATCQRHPAWAPLFREFAEVLSINLGTALLAVVEAQATAVTGSLSSVPDRPRAVLPGGEAHREGGRS